MFRQTKKRISSRRNYDSSFNEDSTINDSAIDNERGNLDGKLSFYQQQPQGEITLEQFEEWGIERLKVLLEIEALNARNKSIKEIESSIKPTLTKFLASEKQKDYYSHFILRLCFCRTKELREKFVKIETLLFKIRFNMLNSMDQLRFIKSLNLPSLQFISQNEKTKYSKELYQTVSSILQFQLNLTDEQSRVNFFQNEKFIKLPFENVIDLVGNRQVFLKDGYVYLPQFQQLNLIAMEFSANLGKQLVKTFQFLPRLNEDDRLVPILNHLSSGYTLADFQSNQFTYTSDEEINAESVWSEEIYLNFPLCMKNLMDGLKQNHHLRYYGRQQLSLFLKGIGLSYEESIKFWTKAFTDGGHISLEKFNKEYRYNFRHNYGLEGNRINYKPWDCRTILSKPRPSKGDFHGCPFRDWSPEKLSTELSAMNLTQSQISSVLDSCQKTEYTVALTKVFEFTHGYKGNPNDLEINEQNHIAHPNLYFEKSRQWQKKQADV
ncbi:hypothetical protein KAFR_0I01750 [Kazachstania africana CBS 2517]|uniref:DNA primase large subunit n=1 Tax=Kazachstania africana (strain ATCC 22294 / BCRC 22015 / CBS 2517 / CECT 1963 / NBRC 1671 / NRRL Y-8276) TaxID=1071382 RepID=H2B006_KAZAF|nr:hypothetical protein KAFR_0I01750 [Kazachstania africana CBS 2517]CCF59956.1 hypothetical protein KAFR_0I01750 [Kazachstania africana CBS 2517]